MGFFFFNKIGWVDDKNNVLSECWIFSAAIKTNEVLRSNELQMTNIFFFIRLGTRNRNILIAYLPETFMKQFQSNNSCNLWTMNDQMAFFSASILKAKFTREAIEQVYSLTSLFDDITHVAMKCNCSWSGVVRFCEHVVSRICGCQANE